MCPFGRGAPKIDRNSEGPRKLTLTTKTQLGLDQDKGNSRQLLENREAEPHRDRQSKLGR